MLAVLWSVVVGAIAVRQWVRPTPEKLAAFLAANPLSAATEAERARIVREAARMLNGLDFEERRSLRKAEVIGRFAQDLTEAERADFFEMTMPDSVRQFAAEFNRMSTLERRRAAARIRRGLQENRSEAADLLENDELARLMREARESFLREANETVRAELGPLLQDAERTAQGLP